MNAIWSHDRQQAYIGWHAAELADLAQRGYASEGRGWVSVWPELERSARGAIGDKIDYWTETTMPGVNRCLLEAVRAHNPRREYVVVFVYPIEGDDEGVLIDWYTVPLPRSFALT